MKDSMTLILAMLAGSMLSGCGDARTDQAGVVEGSSSEVRFDRGFLERPVGGAIAATPGGTLATESSLAWNVRQPEGPAPLPGAIADYRDRFGCAQYTVAGGDPVQLCFLLGGDVSTVQVKAAHMKVENLAPALKRALGCAVDEASVRFQGASRSGDVLRVFYEALAECSATPIQVGFTVHGL